MANEIPPPPAGFQIVDAPAAVQGIPSPPAGFEMVSDAPHVSPQQAAMMTHAGPAPEPREQPIDRITNMIKGNAAEQIPTVNDSEFDKASGIGFVDTLRPAIAGSFGSDKSVADALLSRIPGSTLDQDANGNAVIQLKDGQRFYVNQPGLDLDDIVRGATKAVAFLPAARGAAAALTIPGRIAAGGIGSAATDAAMQVGTAAASGSSDQIDPMQTLIAGGIGLGAEAVPAVAGALARGGKSLVSTDASLAAAGRQIAQKAEIPGTLTDEQAIALGRKADEIRGGADPKAVLAETEFGFNLTRGQKTGDVTQLRREEMLRNLGGDSGAGRNATAVYDAQRANVGEQAQKIQDFLAGGQAPRSPAQAAETVMGSTQRQAGALNDRIGAAYGDARAQRAAVNTEAVNDLPGRLRQAVQDFDIHPDITPATKRTLDSITDAVEKLPPDAKGVTMRAIELQRKRVNNAIGGAANPTDKAALMKVKSTFDGWLDDAFDNALISGDPQALDTLKQARALRYEYGLRFQPKNASDQGGKVVQKLLDSNATPDQMATAIFGAGEVAPQATASVARKIKAAVGDDKEAWDAVRSGVIGKAVINKAGDAIQPGNMVRNLNILMRDRPTLVKELYSPEEVSKLKRFGLAMETLMPKGPLAKSSGTTERALAYFNELLSNVPGGQAMVNIISAPRRAVTSATMMAPVRSQMGAGYTATGSVLGNLSSQNKLPQQLFGSGAEDQPAQ